MKAEERNNWSEYKKISDDNLENVPAKPGVYKIRCKIEGGIQRLAGVDRECLLSIGRASSLKRRLLKQFYRTLREKNYSNHSAAGKYITYDYAMLFPENDIEFCYVCTSDHEGLEYILLLDYRKKFMDLPPLNASKGEAPANFAELIRQRFDVPRNFKIYKRERKP